MKIYPLLVFLSITVSCSNPSVEDAGKNLVKNPNNISFTEDQNKLGDIVIGKLELRDFSEVIVCNGNIEPTPRSLAQITSPYGGVIISINHFIGKKVEKGDVLIRVCP